MVDPRSSAYARSVTTVLEWPRSLLTTSSLSPLFSRYDPKVRRSVCGVIDDTFSPLIVRGQPGSCRVRFGEPH